MVDFDNEATVGTPAIDVQRISILQRRYEFLEAYEAFKKKAYSNPAALSIVKARLLSLFLELQPMLKRRLKADEYEDLQDSCYNGKKEVLLMAAFYSMNEMLDSILLIRVDGKKAYDASDVEAENKVKGYD